MGYYTGNGVVISRRATPVCHCVEWVPTYTAFRRAGTALCILA